MRINKQAVLDKIEAHYQSVAQADHDQQVRRQQRWDEWSAEQTAKSPQLASALRQLAVKVEDGLFITKYGITKVVDELAHDRTVPYSERNRHGGDLDWSEFPVERPEVTPVAELLERYRAGGRFTDLLGVLDNMVGDDVAVSALQKLGVLDAADARLIFKATRA
jgi:hypothetical protein